jgi:hypothetical protein
MLMVNDCSCSDLICESEAVSACARGWAAGVAARLCADFAQVRLEAAQEAFHFAEDAVAAADLLLQRHQVVALRHVVLDGVQLHLVYAQRKA